MPFPSSSLLLEWYFQNARKLPWREYPDPAVRPYAIWVSEIMLQQTRVETVIPFFQRWMARFPNLPALARASEQEVLAAWEGLGYYTRARNLQRAAQIVCKEHGGELPKNVAGLRGLPGIGRYTAAAIASIAFGLDEAALDGNIRRVLARFFDISEPARSPAGDHRLLELAQTHLPSGKAGEYNQALMDLGETICIPRSPACVKCPLWEGCQAFARGIQEQRPVLPARRQVPHYLVAAAVLQRDGQALIARRPSHGLLGGLWEFPGGKLQDGEDLPACLNRELQEELGIVVSVGESFGIYRHAYTHFRVTLHAFHCTLAAGEPRPLQASEVRWVPPPELASYPMGKIDRQIATRLLNHPVDTNER